MLEDCSAVLEVDAEHPKLGGHVTRDTEHLDPSTRDMVQDDDVFRGQDRVAQGQEDGCDTQARVLGTGRDRRGEDER